MLTSARFEVLPTATIEDKILEHLPLGPDRHGHRLARPRASRPTLALTERLARQGYAAVPHLAARMISGRDELAEICARMREAGVRTVFVPGGDQDPPAGSYTAALDLLEDLTALGSPFPEVGDHRLPGVAPHHQRRPDRAGDVGQAPPRHARGQQPQLRPGRHPGLARPDARPRGHDADAARHPRPDRPRQAAGDGDQDRGRATPPGSSPSTRARSPGSPPRAASPASASSSSARPCWPDPRPWSPGCTSTPSTRSPRPRPGAGSYLERLMAVR